MQPSPQHKRQFAGEQPVRRFPQNTQSVQGYEQQGAYQHTPRFQSSQTTVPAPQHSQSIRMQLSPELQAAICKDCPYRPSDGPEGKKQKNSLFSRKKRDRKRRHTSPLILLLALIGFVTVVIQGLRYLILPLVDYFFQLTGGGAL